MDALTAESRSLLGWHGRTWYDMTWHAMTWHYITWHNNAYYGGYRWDGLRDIVRQSVDWRKVWIRELIRKFDEIQKKVLTVPIGKTSSYTRKHSRVWLGRSSYARKSWKKWSDFGLTDRQTDIVNYRVALTRLKNRNSFSNQLNTVQYLKNENHYFHFEYF